MWSMLSALGFPIVVFVAESNGCIKQAPFKLGPDICLLLLNILQSVTKSHLRLKFRVSLFYRDYVNTLPPRIKQK